MKTVRSIGSIWDTDASFVSMALLWKDRYVSSIEKTADAITVVYAPRPGYATYTLRATMNRHLRGRLP